LNQERWDAARRTLQKAIELDPNLSVARERLGYIQWREQRYEEAALSYQHAIELDTKNAAAHAGLGVVRMTQYLSDPEQVAYREQAVESWHQSLEIDPDQEKLRALIEKYRVKKPKPTLSLQD
jgi:tetratricopeptide (TPR) repeat protein